MMPSTVRLVLDVEPDAQPIRGWLEEPDRHRVAFIGLLELLAALEGALADPVPGSGTDRR